MSVAALLSVVLSKAIHLALLFGLRVNGTFPTSRYSLWAELKLLISYRISKRIHLSSVIMTQSPSIADCAPRDKVILDRRNSLVRSPYALIFCHLTKAKSFSDYGLDCFYSYCSNRIFRYLEVSLSCLSFCSIACLYCCWYFLDASALFSLNSFYFSSRFCAICSCFMVS